jgi:hypothetical protein
VASPTTLPVATTETPAPPIASPSPIATPLPSPPPESTPEPPVTISISEIQVKDLSTPTPRPPRATRTPKPPRRDGDEIAEQSTPEPTVGSTREPPRTRVEERRTPTPPVALGPEPRTLEAQVPFRVAEKIPIGVDVASISIETIEISETPSERDLEKAAKRPDDTHKAKVVFTYSNRDTEQDYKCKYVVSVLDRDGKQLGTSDRDASLNKKQSHDTNRMSIKMRTSDYAAASRIRLRFEIKKD